MSWKSLVKWTIGILIVLFFIRIFGVQVEKVQHFSMSSTILPKDRVLISKLRTGLRIPNTVFGLPGHDRAYIDAFRIPHFRLPALSKFKLNHVVAFNDPRSADIPTDRKPLLISRIAALPGDTLIIWNKTHYNNSDIIYPPDGARRLYRVVIDGSSIPDDFIRKFNLEEPLQIAAIGMWDVFLDTIAYQELSKQTFIKSIRSKQIFAGESSSGYWPYSGYSIWNRDQFGPLIVPYKGLKVEIDFSSIDKYKAIIELYEGNQVLVDFFGVKINGEIVSEYTIKKDYYFVLDDNRDNPNDSRIIGFIPEDHLLGRVTRTLWSPSSKSFFTKIK